MTATTDSDFNRIDAELRERLTQLIADERGIDRSSRIYSKCREEAIILINEHRGRLPFTPTNDIERVLVAVIENEAARRAYRETIAAVRAEQLAEVLAQVPEPDPDTVKIVVKDGATGKRLRLSIPAAWVEFRWE